MLAKALTCAVVGLDGAIVEVEVDLSPGLPAFTIVGCVSARAPYAVWRRSTAGTRYGHHGRLANDALEI